MLIAIPKQNLRNTEEKKTIETKFYTRKHLVNTEEGSNGGIQELKKTHRKQIAKYYLTNNCIKCK